MSEPVTAGNAFNLGLVIDDGGPEDIPILCMRLDGDLWSITITPDDLVKLAETIDDLRKPGQFLYVKADQERREALRNLPQEQKDELQKIAKERWGFEIEELK